jgi:hypothetical protein
MAISRRRLVQVASAVAGSGMAAASAEAQGAPAPSRSVPQEARKGGPFTPPAGPRARVIVTNDLCGDVDGLFATVHALLSPSADVRGVVGTGTPMKGETPERSVELAHELLGLMGQEGSIPVHAGGAKLADAATPVRSAGAQAIVDEAMRTDTRLPLFVTAGAGLSEVASAVLMEPRVAERMTLVWIGGGRPNTSFAKAEFNLSIDPLAAQVLFNRSTAPIWQVPSDTYQTCLVSVAELQARVGPCGAVGAWLYGNLEEATRKHPGLNTGETWTLGDSGLVLLSALADWAPNVVGRTLRYDRTGSSLHDEAVAPRINGDGTTGPGEPGRTVRLYRSLDVRLMLEDFFAKLRLNYGP